MLSGGRVFHTADTKVQVGSVVTRVRSAGQRGGGGVAREEAVSSTGPHAGKRQ